ncbi:pilus assembly protein N-terminal domain-containing protein [Alcaligenaceae bacterium]|nr:pilus assembly protein N-terminal domain-containing protein [Alcaligenaceae bacterium]
MQVGEVRVLAIPDVARVAVGDGHVLNAVTTDEKEVIVFARNEGASAMQVWTSDGKRRHYQVDVAAQGTRQIQQELKVVLERIAGARVSTVGDKLLVEGENLSDSDRQRVLELAKRYPQLLDFTSQIGWDRMVLLDVQVIEVPRARLQELGVRWSPSSSGGINAGLSWDGGSKRLVERPGDTVLDLPFPATVAAGYFGVNALLSGRINAMAQSGSALILAQPQLLARSGATAEFLAGGEVPYSTVDANGNTNTSFKPYGVSLRITPRVENNGAIRSHIEVEVSSVDATLSVPNGPSLKTRRAATEFNVHSGQTLVLAGFLSREASRNVDKIPVLGDVPLLGQLFRATKAAQHDTELAIFVTPVVVGADHPGMQQRVEKGLGLLDESFGQENAINVPIRPEPVLPMAASVTADGVSAGGWNPWDSNGSQWLTVATSASPLSLVDVVPPINNGPANQYAFTE